MYYINDFNKSLSESERGGDSNSESGQPVEKRRMEGRGTSTKGNNYFGEKCAVLNRRPPVDSTYCVIQPACMGLLII